MRVLFCTQNKTLALFHDVSQSMKSRGLLSEASFYIADSTYYVQYGRASDLEALASGGIVKEWDILAKAAQHRADVAWLEAKEKELGDPVLWNAILADRRLSCGPKAAYEQDLRARYSRNELLSILEVAIREIEALFNRARPNLVVSFICVTIGEYLTYLIAKARGIPVLNLRPSRIRNYIHASGSVHEPSATLKAAFDARLSGQGADDVRATAQDVLKAVRSNHAMYEGVLPPSANAPKLVIAAPAARRNPLSDRLERWKRYRFTSLKYDNHFVGNVWPLWFKRIKRPLRIKLGNAHLSKFFVDERALKEIDYAFYPLHKEPEVTLLVYGRPFRNQIEVVRRLAESLPIGTQLVVKEHPGAIGYRPLSFYKALLEIPNVLLVRPEVASRGLVKNARLVAVVAGSVALEALMLGTPVIALGHVPFACMPDTMIRSVKDIGKLADEITELIGGYRFNEAAVISFISAVIDTSVPLDFYSVLLGRQGVYRPGGAESPYEVQVDRLADFIAGTVNARMNKVRGSVAKSAHGF